MLRPQQYVSAAVVAAQACAPPVFNDTTRDSPFTRAGTARLPVEPSPSWP
jgi:hypothetical protein